MSNFAPWISPAEAIWTTTDDLPDLFDSANSSYSSNSSSLNETTLNGENLGTSYAGNDLCPNTTVSNPSSEAVHGAVAVLDDLELLFDDFDRFCNDQSQLSNGIDYVLPGDWESVAKEPWTHEAALRDRTTRVDSGSEFFDVPAPCFPTVNSLREPERDDTINELLRWDSATARQSGTTATQPIPVNSAAPTMTASSRRPKRAAKQPRSKPQKVSKLKAIEFQIVLEDGIAPSVDLPDPMSGRRGTLPVAKSASITKKRQEKIVCIRCRQMKVECNGGLPCARCIAFSKTAAWEVPCLKAHFLEIIRGGTCNYISQRTVNHLTLDETRRVTLVLPETFDLGHLLASLKPRVGKYDYQVRQRWGPLFTLDLAKCHSVLESLEARRKNGDKEGLLSFIEDLTPDSFDQWHSCIKGFDRSVDPVTLLLRWNTQPSRASYDTVTTNNGSTKTIPLNIEDPVHQDEFIVVAQLTRLICRALEVQAYTHLQRRLNDKSLSTSDDVQAFLFKLGKVLVMLRWQICWRKLFGGGPKPNAATDPMFKTFANAKVQVPERFIDRMDRLVCVLYFYFCTVRRKLPAFSNAGELFEGTTSEHGDSPPMFDGFPAMDTSDGFERWMKEGEERILRGLA